MDYIRLKSNSATKSEIADHLALCDLDFIPSLSSRVNIADYARKLSLKSTRIEAWCDNVIVGLAAVYGPFADCKAFLTSLSVVPTHRRRGIAEMIMVKTEHFLARREVEVIELQVGVRNEPAKQFYKHLGFEEVASDLETLRLAKNIAERFQSNG